MKRKAGEEKKWTHQRGCRSKSTDLFFFPILSYLPLCKACISEHLPLLSADIFD